MLSRFRTLFVAASLLALAPAAASAGMVTVRDNPDNGGSVFHDGLGRSVGITINGTDRSVGAGVFGLQFQNEGEAAWNNFLSFCLQLNETLSLPRVHTEVSGADYFPNADDRTALGILYGNFLTTDKGLANSTSAAAIQAMIWEIVEDGAANFDLTGGVFRVRTEAVRTAANNFWQMLLSGNFQPVDLKVFAARGTQDIIYSEVPLPAALALMLSGLAGLGFAGRRKRAAE